MPNVTITTPEGKNLPQGTRLLFVMGDLTDEDGELQCKYLKRRNHKRPTRYKGKRKVNSFIGTVSLGRGQRRT